MIKETGLGICVMGESGAFLKAVEKANLVFLNILDALDFLLNLSVNEQFSANKNSSQ
jgi:soluble P-type ATPase